MLEDWQQLDALLRAQEPSKRVPASVLAAVAIHDAPGGAEALCETLKHGWRPVLPHASAPSITYVPWMDHLDSLAAAIRAPGPATPAVPLNRLSASLSAMEVCAHARLPFVQRSRQALMLVVHKVVSLL